MVMMEVPFTTKCVGQTLSSLAEWCELCRVTIVKFHDAVSVAVVAALGDKNYLIM